MIGTELCSALRDAVATSPRYQEVAASPDGYQLKVTTISLDKNVDTAAAMVLVWNGYYINSGVQTCGSNKVVNCAQSMTSSFDDDITSFEKEVAKQAAKR